MSVGVLNRSGCFAVLAGIAVMNFAVAAVAADAPTPAIVHTSDWRAAVHRFAEVNLKHPAWGLSHSVRDGPTVVQRLEHSLTAVPPRIVSKAGKARAPQRVRELEQFLRDLRAESADFRSL